MKTPKHRIRVGENLKAQIEKFEQSKGKKLTINELADNIGVSPDCVYKILNDKRMGSFPVIIALSQYLECNISDLIMP